MLWLLACAADPADLVFRDGIVATMEADGARHTALAVTDGRIAAVGDDPRPWIGRHTEVVELDGRVLLPGFHDAHNHLVWSGADLLMVDLYAARSVSELQEAIVAWADANPDEAWVQGGGWDTSRFYGQIDKSTVDAVLSDRPAWLYSADSHIAVVNSLALEAAGIDASTPDPADGTIERDAAGEPTGILLEGAMDLVSALIPPYADATVDQGLVNAMRQASRMGITGIIDANVDAWMLEGYARAEAAGRLSLRVRGAAYVPPEDPDPVAWLQELDGVAGGGLVEVNAAKLYLDGIIETQTAALLEPYEDGSNAALAFADEDLLRIALALDAAGYQLHAHAIGDAAVRQLLDTVEAVEAALGPRDRRPVGAHLELVDPDDVGRFASLGVVAAFQPLWAQPDSYIQQLTWPVIGEERAEWLYPIGAVVDAGGVFAGGSDWSVTAMNPLAAIEVAVTRQNHQSDGGPVLTPQHLVSVEEALAAYTRHAAFADFTDDRAGTLTVGKDADLVVLSADPLAVDPADLSTIEVMGTWFAGRQVYAWSPQGAATVAARHSHRHHQPTR